MGDLALADAPVAGDHAADDGGQRADGRGGKAQRGGGIGAHALQRAAHGRSSTEAAGKTDGQHHAEPIRGIEKRRKKEKPQHDEQAPLAGEHHGGIAPHIARALAHVAAHFHGIGHRRKDHRDEDGGVITQIIGEVDPAQHVWTYQQADEAGGNRGRQQQVLEDELHLVTQDIADDHEQRNPAHIQPERISGKIFHEDPF